jgi:hypothetical protein
MTSTIRRCRNVRDVLETLLPASQPKWEAYFDEEVDSLRMFLKGDNLAKNFAGLGYGPYVCRGEGRLC